METGSVKVAEQTILERVRELIELLRLLNLGVDNLVSRNPIPEEAKPISPREDNVFDEIIHNLALCRELTRAATERIGLGISRKVQ